MNHSKSQLPNGGPQAKETPSRQLHLRSANSAGQGDTVDWSSESDFANLTAATGCKVLFLDSDLRIRRFTPSMAESLTLVVSCIGQSISEFCDAWNCQSLHESALAALHCSQSIEIPIRDRNGHATQAQFQPYWHEDRVTGVTLRIVPNRKRRDVETDLQRFEFMTEAALDAVTLIDRDGNLVYVNPAACRMLQYDRIELLQMSFADIDSQWKVDWFDRIYEQASEESFSSIQSHWKCKLGRIIPVEMSCNPVAFEGTRYLCNTIRDVTDRQDVQAQMRLQQMSMDAALDGIVIVDAKDNGFPITYVNRGFSKMTGYASQQVLGRNCRFMQGEETDPEAVNQLRNAIRQGESCRVTMLNYRRDGSTFWNDLQITPMHNSAGEVTHYVGVQHDVTQQKLFQEQLQLANALGERASTAKSEFLANMSHELRTPMTAMLGFAQILRTESNEECVVEKVDTIIRNGEYLLSLLNDILDLSKIESGRMDVSLARVDLVTLLNDLQALMGVRADEAGLPLQFIYSTGVPRYILADEKRIRQVLVNLISNALKFTDHGSIRVMVQVENFSKEKSRLLFEVHDTGCGILESEMQDLFKPFSRLKRTQSQRAEGAGLGLSISQRLARQMGGDITVTSQVDKGSIFQLSIPIDRQQLTELLLTKQDGKAEPARDKSSASTLPKLDARILLADDRRDVWRVGKFFLERCGAKVTIAEDGRQAVDEALRARQSNDDFDLVLMDMQMPVMNGREAVAKLRELGFKTPIIALTADAMEGERDACIAMGCDEYFPKPINGNKLMHFIARTLDEHS